jgi:GNAT superfamily N-acetyltransferase
VTAGDTSAGDSAAGARAWRDAAHAAVCDARVRWAHGTVVRATDFPSYFDFNLVQVEDGPEMSVEALIASADTALAGLEHRRVDFDLIEAAEPLRAGFEASGWTASRLVWMCHDAALPPSHRDIRVEEVSYDAVAELRIAWHGEEHPDQDPTDYFVAAREVALRRNALVLAVVRGGSCVAYTQLGRDRGSAEITQVYVGPGHRGGGLGTALTRAAIRAAGDVEDLWIVADDEGRAKDLYGRLGFRPAWTTMEFTLWP